MGSPAACAYQLSTINVLRCCWATNAHPAACRSLLSSAAPARAQALHKVLHHWPVLGRMGLVGVHVPGALQWNERPWRPPMDSIQRQHLRRLQHLVLQKTPVSFRQQRRCTRRASRWRHQLHRSSGQPGGKAGSSAAAKLPGEGDVGGHKERMSSPPGRKGRAWGRQPAGPPSCCCTTCCAPESCRGGRGPPAGAAAAARPAPHPRGSKTCFR